MGSGRYVMARSTGSVASKVDQKRYWEAQHVRRAHEHQELEGIPNLFAIRCADLIPPGGRVVEIGPGNGRDARFFIRRKGCEVVAVDIAEAALAHLQAAAERDGTAARITPLVCRAQELAAESVGRVDAYYARSSLHLDDEEFATFLSLVDRTLRPGGHLMIEGKAGDDPKIRRSDQVAPNLFCDHDGHVRRAWTADGMRACAAALGYALLELGCHEEEWAGTTAKFIHCILRK